MIRRFCSILIFICTVLTASFGQNIVGRVRMEQWAAHIRHDLPKRSHTALHQTDVFLAQLVPEAGAPSRDFCIAADRIIL